MLAISQNSLTTLEATQRPLFARRVRAALAMRYQHFLPRFPEAVQLAVVGNMLGRASRWQISGQQGLLAFCEFMIAVAPSFDEQPEIKAALEQQQGARDQLLTALPSKVSAQSWADAEQRAANLPFFVPPRLIGQPETEQTEAALGLVLHDRPEAAAAAEAVAAASETAARLELGDTADALMVLAACRSFYGDGFERDAPWAAEVFGRPMPPRAVVNALRLRLALDFARFV